MATRHPDTPVVRRAVFALEPERREQVLEVLSYVEALHYHIDPDMFRIELEDVETLKRIFGHGEDEPPTRISVTHHELFVLTTCVDAADAYSHRKSSGMQADLSEQQFADLYKWLSQNERWFLTPLPGAR